MFLKSVKVWTTALKGLNKYSIRHRLMLKNEEFKIKAFLSVLNDFLSITT